MLEGDVVRADVDDEFRFAVVPSNNARDCPWSIRGNPQDVLLGNGVVVRICRQLRGGRDRGAAIAAEDAFLSNIDVTDGPVVVAEKEATSIPGNGKVNIPERDLACWVDCHSVSPVFLWSCWTLWADKRI